MREAIQNFIERHGWTEEVQSVQSALSVQFFHNTVLDYLVAAVTLVILTSVLMIALRIVTTHLQKIAEKTATDLDNVLTEALSYIKAPSIIVVSLYISTRSLELIDIIQLILKYLLVFVVTFRAVQVLQTIAQYAVRNAYFKARPKDLAAETAVKNITFAVRWGLWALALIFVLDNLGIDITTLVAGLGIGGIAVAMASQAILGDAFSAVSIFVDKPFEVGDFIIVADGFLGTVEHVGIKTTRVRSLYGEQVIFANSDLTSSRIKNYKRMYERRIAFQIGVTHQTTYDQLKKIPEIVKEIAGKMQGIRLDRVHFFKYGDFSLNYEIVYYVLSPDYNIYMDKQQELNLAIKQAFEKEGIEFAYPTQTLFLSKLEAESHNSK